MALYIIFALVISFFAIAFALQNPNLVTINLLVWEFQESLAIVLLLTLAIGLIVGLLIAVPSIVKRGWRVSRTQKQNISLEEQLIAKEQDIVYHKDQTFGLRQSYKNLLQALNLTAPATGLLSSQALSPSLQALLHQMKLQPNNSRFNSLGLLTIHPHRIDDADGVATESETEKLLDQIAKEIEHNLPVDSWLFSDDQGQFFCTLSGFDLKALNQCAETIKSALTENPLRMSDGDQASLNVNIGGVWANRDNPTNSEQLIIDKAHEALEKAQKRGQNQVRVVKVTD